MPSANASEIVKQLAAEIHAGNIVPGAMLPAERDLCDRFSVSRNVVRGALTVLNGMGLTEQEKGHRPRVVAPTLANVMEGAVRAAQYFFSGAEGLAHLEQARLFLETSLVRYAVMHATNAQIGKLLEGVERCEATIGHLSMFREADVQFHRALAEIPGNPIFIALHGTFVERLMRSRVIVQDMEAQNRTSNDEHRKIVTAILEQDAEMAVSTLTTHLTRNYGNYFRHSLRLRAKAAEDDSPQDSPIHVTKEECVK